MFLQGHKNVGSNGCNYVSFEINVNVHSVHTPLNNLVIIRYCYAVQLLLPVGYSDMASLDL